VVGDRLEALARRLGWSDDVLAEVRRATADQDRTLDDLTAPVLPEPERPTLVAHTDQGRDTAELLDGQVQVSGPVAEERDRYTDLGVIGRGGMGEVRRVRDRRLGRVVAMKLLRDDLGDRAMTVAQFTAEAQVAAQLQHPGIPPVHDEGSLPDGRRWFTMKEVRGRTLHEAIVALHEACRPGRWEVPEDGLSFPRLIDVFAKVCEAVGYAHARGVIHRDLKPDNVMIGAHGEVLVLDWGIAKVLGRDEPRERVTTLRDGDDALQTRFGAVTGTPAYMSPEQAQGNAGALGPRSDVYSLGVILYELLTGAVPYEGDQALEVITAMLLGRRSSVAEQLAHRHATPPPLPPELVELCDAAMAAEPAHRPADASAMAEAVRAWLEGARRRERAEALVAEAEALGPRAKALRRQAEEARAEAAERLASVPAWADADAKRPGWERLDTAEAAEHEAERLDLEAERLLSSALSHEPLLEQAHARLVAGYLEEHRRAEALGDRRRTTRAELRLVDHVEHLPAAHPASQQAAAYLRGVACLDLVTDPAGAEAVLRRYDDRGRRWVLGPAERLGPTPIRGHELPMGSYLVELSHPGRATVRYPVHVGRGERWHGVAPGASDPTPIGLPPADQVGPDDCVVPPGWFRSGGDPEATGSLAARRRWCDGFVIRRFPATHRRWLAFIQDLVDRGLDDEVQVAVPRDRGTDAGPGSVRYLRDGDRVALPEGWALDEPAILVDYRAAWAYARWVSERSGQAWRLPAELEWEKAGRGVDGRFLPWGNHFDPSWCCLGDSHPGAKRWAPVDSFPVDTSPYGVRGLAGNVRDWCADAWLPDGPDPDHERVSLPTRGRDDAWRVRRGGSWGDMPGRARLADRDWYHPGYRFDYLGVRLVRSL